MQERVLTQYSLYKLTQDFWRMPFQQRHQCLSDFIRSQQQAADSTFFYQVFPVQSHMDLLVWSNVLAEEDEVPNSYMEGQARALNPFRSYIQQTQNFWGMTKPSMYSKAKRSAQEIDPFSNARLPYFIIYPFTKTSEWYLKSREERQEMMNGHIKIGKSYPEITQLLLYSFGLQDQEFIVAYETHDLSKFSDLVYELRMTEARLYTLNDTPIVTGMLRAPEHLADIFSGSMPDWGQQGV